MAPSTPPWLRAASAVVGLAIIGGQAIGNYMDGRAPNVILLIVGCVMIGLVSPEILSRLFGGGKE